MYRLLRPLLFLLPAETAHELALLCARAAQAAALPLLWRFLPVRHQALRQRCLGLVFDNPVGVAAGLDKDALAFRFFEAIGFGFSEIGSVSALPWAGNPKPRAFRLPLDRAIVNRMGLPSAGAEVVARRLLADPRRPRRAPLGVNLVKTADAAIVGPRALADFSASYQVLARCADYVTLNISCPNTTDGRTFEEPEALDELLATLAPLRGPKDDKPLLLKLSPAGTTDQGRLRELLQIARGRGVSGLVLTNTTTERAGLRTPPAVLARIDRHRRGGLSGPPLAVHAEAMVRAAYRLTEGALPIIGVGGIDSAEAAYRRLRAGASLVQIYTGLVYEGPDLARRINQGLVRLLERDGLGSVSEAVGLDA